MLNIENFNNLGTNLVPSNYNLKNKKTKQLTYHNLHLPTSHDTKYGYTSTEFMNRKTKFLVLTGLTEGTSTLTVGSFLHRKRIRLFDRSAFRYSL